MRTQMSIRKLITTVLVAAFLAFLAGCGSNDSDEAAPAPAPAAASRSYVGTVQGSDALLAVAFDGTRVLAYACDGVPGDPVGTPPKLQAWFNAPSDGRSVDASQPAGRLQLQLTETTMSGMLTLTDGRTLPVTGRATTGDAGLYRADTKTADGGAAVAGWILAPDGTQRGGVGGTLISGTTLLNTTQLTFSFQSLATARISRVGITPIPIP